MTSTSATGNAGVAPDAIAASDSPDPGRPAELTISVQSGQFKSISPPFEWNHISPLAVLTGLNGSGKTQLLVALATHFGIPVPGRTVQTSLRLSIEGQDFAAHQVLFFEDLSRPLGAPVLSAGQIDQQIQNYRGRSQEANIYERRIADVIRTAGDELSLTEYYVATYSNPISIERAFATHCVAHLQNCKDEVYKAYRQGHDIDVETVCGPPPWLEMNEWFESAGFSYRFCPLEELPPRKKTAILLEDVESGNTVSLADLSAGEASIIRFLLIVYATTKELYDPKLILLDEPDGHLHPSLIHVFMRLLEELVERYQCRVIMTTHRVETVGFAPKDSVYFMRRDNPRIMRYETRKTVGMLTGNLYGLIFAGKRPVFVEGDDDERFFSAAMEILLKQGQWTGSRVPEFVAVSRWAAIGQRPGGRPEVERAVSVMSAAGLENNVTGLVDRDKRESAVEGVYVLSRTELENYLLDPIIVFATLLERENAPEISEELEIAIGEEWKIAELDNAKLQRLADYVIAVYVEAIPSEVRGENGEETENITYVGGQRISVPSWLLRSKGKKLLGSLSAKAVKGVNQRELIKAFRKIRMVPADVRDAMVEAIAEGAG